MSEDFEFRAQDSAISLKALGKKFVIFRRSKLGCTVDLEPADRCNLFVRGLEQAKHRGMLLVA